MFQWLELGTFTAEALGSISYRGTKILQAAWHRRKRKKRTCLWQFVMQPHKSRTSVGCLLFGVILRNCVNVPFTNFLPNDFIMLFT